MIKKIAISSLLISSLFGLDLKGYVDGDFKVLSKTPFSDDKNLNLIIIENNNKKIPLIVSNDEKIVFSYPEYAKFDDKKIDEILKTTEQGNKAYTDKIVYEMIKKSIPKENIVQIDSFYKNNPNTMYIISDPECPYCREEMAKMSKWLRNANVKIILAPVHGESAFTKSAIILQKSKEIGSKNQEKMVELIKEYYDPNKVVKKSDATDAQRSVIFSNVKTIFSRGVVTGVPYSFVVVE